VDALVDCGNVEHVLACARAPYPHPGEKVQPQAIDITDEESIVAALNGIDRIDLAIVATGLLHSARVQPEKSWRVLDKSILAESMMANAIGPALVAKHVLPRLPRTGKSVFAALSARVGSIADNRLGGWYGYRASKAALNQLIRTFSIELARTRPRRSASRCIRARSTPHCHGPSSPACRPIACSRRRRRRGNSSP
jgi:NAD(P)-dependent dehydrogenase (short-subunit alcohol dehydrogenase family)